MTDLDALVLGALNNPDDVAAWNSLRDACEEKGYQLDRIWRVPGLHISIEYWSPDAEHFVATDAIYLSNGKPHILGPHTVLKSGDYEADRHRWINDSMMFSMTLETFRKGRLRRSVPRYERPKLTTH